MGNYFQQSFFTVKRKIVCKLEHFNKTFFFFKGKTGFTYTFTFQVVQSEKFAIGVAVLVWRKSLGYWRTPGELVLNEEKAYNISFVPVSGECNIVDDT